MDDSVAHAVGGDVDVVWNYRYDQIGAGCDRPTRYLVGPVERVESVVPRTWAWAGSMQDIDQSAARPISVDILTAAAAAVAAAAAAHTTTISLTRPVMDRSHAHVQNHFNIENCACSLWRDDYRMAHY